MKKTTLIRSALIAASLPFFAGCVEREVVYRDRPAAPSGEVVVADEAPAPPPPQVDVVTVAPGPPALWFWAPGGWEWHNRWVWYGGHWMARPHPGAVWIGGGWAHHGRNHVWVRGHWR